MKNPSPDWLHIAVGESGVPGHEKGAGVKPVINIYEWPNMDIVAVLREGTTNSYANLDYSPDGSLLASVGGSPDYNLTVWDWQNQHIILRCSAFSNSVYNVQFSPYIPGHLVTSGAGHIKFWKMASTFTGLKLKGELGRFGKTEICDIVGVYAMPDEKVLSGCSWGNILVWEAGLVKVQVCRKGHLPCHSAPITQLIKGVDSSEVSTVGLDGRICTWYWDSVSQAKAAEGSSEGQEAEQAPIELNPVAELAPPTPTAKLMAISHRSGTLCFAQDASGSIWTVNLDLESMTSSRSSVPSQDSHSHKSKEDQRVIRSHGGPILGLAVLRGSSLLFTLGTAEIMLHRVPSGPLLFVEQHPYNITATTMLYLPAEIDATGRSLVIGFEDGTIRSIVVNTAMLETELNKSKIPVQHDSCISVLQVWKPHSAALSCIAINSKCNRLLTAGEDRTVFVYLVHPLDDTHGLLHVSPLFFVSTTSTIRYIACHPQQEFIVLMCGDNGLLMTAELADEIGDQPQPSHREDETEMPDVSYSTSSLKPKDKIITSYSAEFKSTKITILKDYQLRYTPVEDNDDVDGDQDVEKESADSHTADNDLPEIELVSDPSKTPLRRVLWASYCSEEGEVWAAQEGLGCLLRLLPGSPIPSACAPLPDYAWNSSPASHIYIDSLGYILLGLSDGELFLLRLPSEEEDDSQEVFIKTLKRQHKLQRKAKRTQVEVDLMPVIKIRDYLRLPMHQNDVTHMALDSNGYLFTAGRDGNIFSYKVNLEIPVKESSEVKPVEEIIPDVMKAAIKVEAVVELTHEELAQAQERDRLMKEALSHKTQVQAQLAELAVKMKALLNKNSSLPLSQQIDISMHPVLLQWLQKDLERQAEKEKQRLQYPLAVANVRLNKLKQRFIDPLDVFPFSVASVLKENFHVDIIRQKKLTDKFYTDLEKVKQLLHEEALKARGSEEAAYVVKPSDREEAPQPEEEGEEVALLRELPPSPPPPRALARALRTYLLRRNLHLQQRAEWEAHQACKVALDQSEAEESELGVSKAMKQAASRNSSASQGGEEDYGQYWLKTDLENAPPLAELNQTLMEMFVTRQEMYEVQHKFNQSVVDLRTDKQALMSWLEVQVSRLQDIAEELPQELVRPAPFMLPKVDLEKEHPERNLEMTTYLQKDVKSNMQASQTSHEDSCKEDTYTAYWNMIKKHPERADTKSQVFQKLKNKRIRDLQHEQDVIIYEMTARTSAWEECFLELSNKRTEVLMRAQILKLHLLFLTQQHDILAAFQTRQDALSEIHKSAQADTRTLQEKLRVLRRQITSVQAQLDGRLEAVKELEKQQARMQPDSRYAAFLRRVYRKKYKPPKNESDEFEDSEESDDEDDDFEESDDEDDSDLEGAVHLDSDNCPPGCDPEIYEQTVQLRQLRYEVESEMRDDEKVLEGNKKEMGAVTKQLNTSLTRLEKAKGDLKELMREKQLQLNAVECVVLLKASQCEWGALEALCRGQVDQVLVMPAPQLQRLHLWVRQLQEQTLANQKTHESNKQHLKYLKADCTLISSRVDALHAECWQAVERKLGPEGARQGAGALLGAVLSTMLQAFKAEVERGLTRDMHQQLNTWQRKESEAQQRYCALLQKHTATLRLAAALQEELLQKHAGAEGNQQDTDRGEETHLEFRKDLAKLRNTSNQQKTQIENLRAEVQRLKLKPRVEDLAPPPPAFTATPPSGSHSRLATPPTQTNTQSSRWSAAVLAQLLQDARGQAGQDDDHGALVDCVTNLLPDLLAGKLNTHQAADKIVDELSKLDVEENSAEEQEVVDVGCSERELEGEEKAGESANKTRLAIADVLTLIIKQSLEKGEVSGEASDYDLHEVDWRHMRLSCEPRATTKSANTARSLLSRGGSNKK